MVLLLREETKRANHCPIFFRLRKISTSYGYWSVIGVYENSKRSEATQGERTRSLVFISSLYNYKKAGQLQTHNLKVEKLIDSLLYFKNEPPELAALVNPPMWD